jgi:hypothetical protein
MILSKDHVTFVNSLEVLKNHVTFVISLEVSNLLIYFHGVKIYERQLPAFENLPFENLPFLH